MVSLRNPCEGPYSFEWGLKYGCSTGTGDKEWLYSFGSRNSADPAVVKQGWGGHPLFWIMPGKLMLSGNAAGSH